MMLALTGPSVRKELTADQPNRIAEVIRIVRVVCLSKPGIVSCMFVYDFVLQGHEYATHIAYASYSRQHWAYQSGVTKE